MGRVMEEITEWAIVERAKILEHIAEQCLGRKPTPADAYRFSMYERTNDDPYNTWYLRFDDQYIGKIRLSMIPDKMQLTLTFTPNERSIRK